MNPLPLPLPLSSPQDTFHPTVWPSSIHTLLILSEVTMTTNEQALEQTSPPVEAGLDEDSLTSSLARLQELHISVCHSLTLKTYEV